MSFFIALWRSWRAAATAVMTKSMSPVSPIAREAIALASAGNYAAALSRAKEALFAAPEDAGLHLFVGLLHSRLLAFPEAVNHFREAVRIEPNDPVARLELARVLIATGALAEAEAALGSSPLPGSEGNKLRAAICAARGDSRRAAVLLRPVVHANPADFESWSQLGSALFQSGDFAGAANALKQSLTLRPDQPDVWDRWVYAIVAAGGGAEALDGLDESRTESVIAGARILERLERSGEAIARLEKWLVSRPGSLPALVALAELQERTNQVDALAETIGKIRKHDPNHERLPLLEARLALREGRFDEARSLAENASEVVDPGRRFQLIGEACNRLEQYGEAWAAFMGMNLADGLANAGTKRDADKYMARLESELGKLTPQWAARWQSAPPPRREPAILLGFPRSGTTLLDTFLGAHPKALVSEENPLIPTLGAAIGELRNVPTTAAARIAELRELYWSKAAEHVPDLDDRLMIDKFPFALVAAPFIHRVFPTAPILFVERHPCDVVVSCLFTRFQPIDAAAAFNDLESTARLYDLMMRFWTRSRELLDLNVLEVRYETMVEDSVGVMRNVAAFLGLEWVDELGEHRAAAQQRGHIKTPSYAQVTEPIYRRSIERWRNYRSEMETALPILEPWVKQLGYSL